MLESLFIKNIALIDEVHINFKSGLNILTGETGAGKSMIISAINFLRGRKIDKMNIRKNCDMALIEGTFSICDEIILKSLNDLGIDVYEDNLIIISRKYNLGKVVNRVNGRNVTVGMLREISDYLLEFHGQNENQKLLDSKSHLEILDRFCMKKILPVKEKLNMKLKELRESEKIVDKLTGQTDLDNKIMMLEFQIKEISNANLILGEEENLQARYKMLSNAKNLCEKMSHAMNLIYNAENCSAMDMISHANQLLNEIKNEDESQKNICDVIESVAINLDDVKNDFANALSNYEEILNNGMQEMREIEKRLDFLYELKTKYKRSVDEIIEYLSVLNNQYENLTGSSEKIKELEDRVAKLKEEVLFLCEQLSEIRKDYSKIICSQIEKNLFDLGMIDAKIQINFEKKSSFNENGFDDIQPQPHAVPVRAAGGVGFVEPVKQQGQLLRRDGRPQILDGGVDLAVLFQAGDDVRLVRRGLDVTHQQQDQNNDHYDHNGQKGKNGVKHFRDLLTILNFGFPYILWERAGCLPPALDLRQKPTYFPFL